MNKRICVLSGLVMTVWLCCFVGMVSAKQLFDDFSGTHVNDQKWPQLSQSSPLNEIVREVVDGKLVSKVGNNPTTLMARCMTIFPGATNIQSIQSDVVVNETVLDTGSDAMSFASVDGRFYNSRSSGGATGDIAAMIYIGDRGNGLEAWWLVLEFTTDDQSGYETVGTGPISVPGLQYGNAYTVKLEYDGATGFTFTVAGETASFNSGPARQRDAVVTYRGLKTGAYGYDGATGIGYASATFDNVFINNETTAYDTFDEALNPSLWMTGDYSETAIELVDGSLRLNQQGVNQQTEKSLFFSDTDAAFVEAGVRVEHDSFASSGAEARVGLGGYYYNDSKGTGSGVDYNGFEGDVYGQVMLQVNSTGSLNAIAVVSRSNDSNGSNFGMLYGRGFTTSISFDTDYRLSIEYGNSQLIFKCNDETLTYTITTPEYKPSSEYRRLRTVLYLESGESAYMKARVDDVYVDSVSSKIPDTAQVISYTDTFGEDADYTITPPSYTKLSADGSPLSDDANEWAMIKDNVTGLIWENKTDDGGIHDKDSTYTWQNAQEAFIAQLNSDQVGGHSDWRLPTVKELQMLVDRDRNSPSINTAYFSNTLSANYWSATAGVGGNSDGAWSVGFYLGGVYGRNKSNALHVRAVCGGASPAFGDSILPERMVDNGDGTVTDTQTGLMWQQAEGGTMMWEDALAYCENSQLAGYDDWRLPSINELQSIADYSQEDPAIDTVVFPGALPSAYWSSTSFNPYSVAAWSVHFNYGLVGYFGKSNSLDVRPVRGGPVRKIGTLEIGVGFNNWIRGLDFPSNTPLSLTINSDPALSTSITTDGNGSFYKNVWEFNNYQLQSGDVVTVSLGTGQPLTLTIPADISAAADTAGDVISGTAPGYEGKTFEIRIFSANGGPLLYSISVIVDGGGNFSSDLPLAAGGNFDLVPGQVIQVIKIESNGNKLYFNVYNAIPFLTAMIDHNWIQGQNFPPDTDVDITIEGGNTVNFLITTDANGFFFANADGSQWPGYSLQRGDTIDANYNGQQASMVIQDLNASVDADADLITGTALTPGTGSPISDGSIYIDIKQQWETPILYAGNTSTLATGAFSLNTFTDKGFDLLSGQKIWLMLTDSQGNRTAIAPYNGMPYLEACAGQNWINGHDFPYNMSLSLTINSDPVLTASMMTDGNGNFFKNVWEFNNYQLKPGDIITVSYGTGESLTLTIPANISAAADTAGDGISGTALGYEEKTLEIRISSADGSQMLYTTSVIVDGGGNFSSDLPLAAGGNFDLVRGQVVHVIETESTGNKIYFNVYNAIPYLVAMINHNWIQGQNFPPDTDVDITIDGGNTVNFLITTDANGFFLADGSQWPGYSLQRGDTLDANYNDQQASMIIQDLNASVDAGADLITGTAFIPGTGTPTSEGGINIGISSQDWAQSLYDGNTTVQATGAFSLNTFTDKGFDLLTGQKIWLVLTDSQGNNTIITPYNGIPALEASVGENTIQGYDFPYNMTLSLTINSDPALTASVTTNGIGDFFKNVGEFNSYQLQAGDVITVSYGTGESMVLTVP